MISKIALYCIDIYRKYISVLKFRRSCRFYPTCSDYAYQSIEKHGFLRGIFYSTKRLLKCHPFHQGGYDPVK